MKRVLPLLFVCVLLAGCEKEEYRKNTPLTNSVFYHSMDLEDRQEESFMEFDNPMPGCMTMKTLVNGKNNSIDPDVYTYKLNGNLLTLLSVSSDAMTYATYQNDSIYLMAIVFHRL